MRAYREIPPTIKAIQWEGGDISDFSMLNGVDELTLRPFGNDQYVLSLRMFGRELVLQPGQWLVRNGDGCSVMSNSDFLSKYESEPRPCVP